MDGFSGTRIIDRRNCRLIGSSLTACLDPVAEVPQ